MRLIALLAVIAVLVASGVADAQDEPYTSKALALTAEQFSNDWPGCSVDGDAITCADGISARLADGKVVAISKRFDPPVLLPRAKAWLPDTLPSDAMVGRATVDTDPMIITEQVTSAGLAEALGEDTIIISYALNSDRRGITSTSATVRGR